FIMMRSFAAQSASNFAVTPGEVTIFAARAANGSVTSADAQTMRLTVTSIPTGKGLTWTTSDKSIVQVTDSGDITAASSGEANITVTHTDGRQAACKVKVVAAPTENWAASADTKWYDDNKTSSAFTITTAAQLAGLAKLVNAGSEDFSDKTITLSNDIDLSAGEWTAIGTDAEKKRFSGTFDGGGHAITGLYINEAGADYQGLFGCIKGPGAVKGIRLSGCVTGGDFVGGVAGQNSRGVQDLNINGSTVTNCTMTGSVNGTSEVGGVAGDSGNWDGTVTNCGWLADAAASGVGKNDNRTASPGVASFDAANIPITTILFDDYDLKAVVNTSSDITVRTYPRASYALQTAVSQNIAKIENFAISGDATVARVTGTKTGSADVMVSAIVARGAKNYKAQMQARLTVLPEPPKPAPPKPDPPQPDPAPAPAPDPKPTPESGSSGGCSAGAGGIAMLVLAAAAMLGRKGKR
ncbi:MAG: Ig-like domain-containing protein, partial [Cloacibacillus sp.]